MMDQNSRNSRKVKNTETNPFTQFQGYAANISSFQFKWMGQHASPGLHLSLCCFLGCKGRRPMRRVAELGWCAALLAQWSVCTLGLGVGWERGLGVLPLGLLLFVAGQAEEEAKDGFQITIPNLCGSGRRKMWDVTGSNRQMKNDKRRTNQTKVVDKSIAVPLLWFIN